MLLLPAGPLITQAARLEKVSSSCRQLPEDWRHSRAWPEPRACDGAGQGEDTLRAGSAVADNGHHCSFRS